MHEDQWAPECCIQLFYHPIATLSGQQFELVFSAKGENDYVAIWHRRGVILMAYQSDISPVNANLIKRICLLANSERAYKVCVDIERSMK